MNICSTTPRRVKIKGGGFADESFHRESDGKDDNLVEYSGLTGGNSNFFK